MSAAASPGTPLRLLVIDTGRDLAETLSTSPERYRVDRAADGRSGASALQAAAYDVILADLAALADLSFGDEHAVTRLARLGGTALLLVVSTTDSVSAAVEALQAGAHDCLARPVSLSDLDARIAVLRLRHDRRGIPPPMARRPQPGPGRVIAEAPTMIAVLDQLARIAGSPAPVFLSGESGTGKRLAAETLHALGPQAGKPLVAVNCAMTLPRAESPGIDAGLALLAGGDGARALIGAGGGLLYLNEIGALGPSAQARLLNLVAPDGATVVVDGRPVPLMLRIVCATQQSPAALIGNRTLREDLFYRLNVLPIHLPPLRQRPQDIAPLAAHFLTSFARVGGKRLADFTPGALAYLDAHEWPGNVRQLEFLMRRVVAMFEGVTVTPQMLAAADTEGQARRGPSSLAALQAGDEVLPMWRQEQRIIEAAIARYGGNVARAAAALEISPSTIYRKKQAWEERQDDRLSGAA